MEKIIRTESWFSKKFNKIDKLSRWTNLEKKRTDTIYSYQK